MNTTLIPALIGLCGVIIGALISSFINLRLKTKETKLKLQEKVFDKRIAAHEEILDLGMRTKTVIGTNKTDENGNVISYPQCMDSMKNLSSFWNDINFTYHKNTRWLNTELIRELSFLCDYIATLRFTVENATDEQLREIGLMVKQDFINLAMKIDNLSYDFFRKDIYSLELNQNSDWHKFPKVVTIERLKNTLLGQNKALINEIISGEQ